MSIVESDVKQVAVSAAGHSGPRKSSRSSRVDLGRLHAVSHPSRCGGRTSSRAKNAVLPPAFGYVCQYLLGRHSSAIDTLKQGDGARSRHYYLAKCHFAQERYDQAIASFESAKALATTPTTARSPKPNRSG